MVFTGFNLKYPEYEVITPQTKLSFNVRSLNVQEEENLKGSLLSPHKVTEHLNKAIYDCITSKPEHIKDFETFLKSVTLKDRDALLYGLYHVTYEEIRNYDITCGSCGRDYPVTVKASDTFSYEAYPGENILKHKVKVPLKISKGVTAVIKQPTLKDEISSIKSLGNRPGSSSSLINEILIIDSFEQDIPEQADPLVYKDKVDILDAYKTLPSRDKKVIFESYMKEFGNYGIFLKMRTNCIHCGNDEVIDIDLVSNFFRMVYSS